MVVDGMVDAKRRREAERREHGDFAFKSTLTYKGDYKSIKTFIQDIMRYVDKIEKEKEE